MKKIILLAVISLLSTGCFEAQDQLEDTQIYTTVYPITFLIETLYEDNAYIDSIYPADANISDYTFTSKQKEEYSEGSLFIYNGLTTEKNLAKDFVNNNNNILLIDASQTLIIENSVEELWLSPNNYLMLAKNIRDNLNEYIENQYTNDIINDNYDLLAETLSIMDADLRTLGKKAEETGNNMLLVTSNAFMFLENYGFNIISLENEKNTSETSLSNIKNDFNNGKYLGLVNEFDDSSEYISSLTGENKINMTTMYKPDEENDYISLMHEFIGNLEAIIN